VGSDREMHKRKQQSGAKMIVVFFFVLKPYNMIDGLEDNKQKSSDLQFFTEVYCFTE
jgi:hypothetical protein